MHSQLSNNKARESSTEVSKMRKYYKLFMCVVTVLSLIFLIFYKSQYDKLYNVLEVLDFFGPAKNSLRCSTEISIPPSFQRVDDDLYVYSAFCMASPVPGNVQTHNCSIVAGLAVARVEKIGEAKNWRCQIWIDGSILSFEGVVSVTRLGQGSGEKLPSDFATFQLNCESKYPSVNPYGVTFKTENGEGYLHVEEPLGDEFTPFPGVAGACLLPQGSPKSSFNCMLGNVWLNSYFGIKNFYIYEHGMGHAFAKFASAAQGADASLLIRVLPFATPVPMDAESIKSLVENDCFFRTRRIWETRVVLNVTQILVPRSRSTVSEALKVAGKRGQLVTKVLRFCAELPHKESSPQNTEDSCFVMLKRSKLIQSANDPIDLWHKMDKKHSDEFEISSSDIVVHDYAPCGKLEFDDESVVTDSFLENKADEIMRSFNTLSRKY